MMKPVLFSFWAGVILLPFSAVYPAPPKTNQVAPTSPFGIGSCHINNRSVNDNARWMPQIADIGIHVMRSPQVSWGALEPEKGKWNWEGLDKQIQYFEANGFEYGALLIGNPKWNTADPAGSLPVNNLEGWSNYVTNVVTHLKDRTKRYEIWNEPPNFTGKDQTPADYAKIVVAAYDAAKAVDPDCLVGIAAKSVHVHYLEETILAGAKDHFDYVVLHPYEVLDGIAQNSESEAVFMNITPVIRKMLAKQNPSKTNVPIVFTELGVSSKKGLDVQAHALIKAYTMSIAQGVECVQWFEGRDGDSGPLGLLDRKGIARPAYTALGSMIEHFGQHPKPIGWTSLNEKHYAFIFEGEKGTVMATWGHAGTADVVAFDDEVSIIDPTKNKTIRSREVSLSSAPVFILDAPEELISQAKANQRKPFPWNGDFSNVSEVSIEFGETTIERGLHTRSGTQIAEAVVAYGGSARAGSVPGGNVFIVDPNFLSYDKTPIEIEVVVRRNPGNDNAGFKLVYESVEGFKTSGGWYTVPDNKEWHTKTWRVDDPKFVNYWGYNFILESDGNKFNNYLIKSVTVRKLTE